MSLEYLAKLDRSRRHLGKSSSLLVIPDFEKKERPLHYHRRSGGSRNPERHPCVYFLASRRNGTLYVGVTSNPALRVWQHQNQLVEGFTKRYGVHTLVWYEVHATMESAIVREKAIKNWKRAWKIALIEKSNSQWRDLYEELG